MDATTVMAIISSAVVFCGWLVLPHTAQARPVKAEAERVPAAISA